MRNKLILLVTLLVILISGGAVYGYETELVTVEISLPFDSSTYNAKVASEYIDGKQLEPGEEFKFNSTVGERTIERGFVEGGVISRGRNGPVYSTDIGGGVCRMSTALYQAAKKTGLRVTERYSHSLPVPYADSDNDAAVAWGYKDLRFKNSTEYPIKINTKVDRGGIEVRLLHVKPDTKEIKIFDSGHELRCKRSSILHIFWPLILHTSLVNR